MWPMGLLFIFMYVREVILMLFYMQHSEGFNRIVCTFLIKFNQLHACLCENVDWLIIYCFTSHSRIFLSYKDVNIDSKGLQNFGLCLALRAFEQGGILIMSHLFWNGASSFSGVYEGWPQLIDS
jgi:hypothetical protein